MDGKNIPNACKQIMFEIYDNSTKAIMFQTYQKVSLFGFSLYEATENVEITNKIKAILTRMEYTGNPDEDFGEVIRKFSGRTVGIKFEDANMNGAKVDLKEVAKV